MFNKAFFKNALIFTAIVGIGVAVLYWYDHQQTNVEVEGQETTTLESVLG